MTTTEAEDTAARAAAIRVEDNVLVTAPAGSGKTELLVQRALACLAVCLSPEEVLLITFTNKAANEIRERLMQALQAALVPAPTDQPHKMTTWRLASAVLERDRSMGWGLLLNPGRIRALTIDALNGALSAQAPVSSGMGGGIGVQERPHPIYRDAILSLFGELDSLEETDPLRPALSAVLRYAKNRIEDLIPLLSAMLQRRDQWLPLIAAGDVVHLRDVLEPIILSRMDQVIERLDPSMMDRIAAASCQAGRCSKSDWPEAAAEALGEWRALAGVLLTGKDELRKTVRAPDGFPPKEPRTEAMKQILAELQDAPDRVGIEEALAHVQALPDLADAESIQLFDEQVRSVLIRLAAHLKLAFMRAGALDFPEVARRALDALSDPEGCTSLLERMDYQIKHILLDEAQDTSSSQYLLLMALTEGWSPGDGHSLFIVGDAQQSIYMFRQADVARFARIKLDGVFNGIPLKCLRLSRNFRSDQAVTSWCNRVFTRVFPAVDDVHSGAVPYTPFESARGDTGGAVQLHWFTGEPETEEAERVVQIVEEARRRDSKATIAVLARNRPHVKETLAALKRAGIKFSCKDIDPLSSTPAVRDTVALIRSLWHSMDRVSWGVLLRTPFVGLSYADMLAVTRGRTVGSLLGALRARASAPEVSPEGQVRITRLLSILDTAMADQDLAGDLASLAEATWNALGGPACVTAAEAEDVRAVFRLLRDHQSAGRLTHLDDFLDALAALYASPEAGDVQVMTAHASKGLEWDVTIIVGLWRPQRRSDPPLLAYRATAGGTLVVPAPGPRAGEGHERLFKLVHGLNCAAEEREALRLLYVACTRARQNLHIISSAANGNAPGGSLLAHLWPALASDFAASNAPAAMGRKLDTDLSCPLSPRLPSGWSYPAITGHYVPPTTRTLMPSEMAVREELPGADQDLEVFDRLVGTAFHETIAYLMDRDQVNQFDQLRSRIAVPMAAGLRRRGMPEPRVGEAVARVLSLIQKTLDSDDGQWIVRRRERASNEMRLSGFLDGDWASAVLDRYFDDDGQIWLIDWKTGGSGLTGPALDAYVAHEAERYRPQLDTYRKMLGIALTAPIRTGIYFAEAARFVRI